MMQGLTYGMDALVWGINQDGYEIEDVPARKSTKTYSHIGRGLLDGHIRPAHTIIRSLKGPIMELYPNREFPGLFFTFINTPSEPEPLKEFISKHGLLTRYKLEPEGYGNLQEGIDYLIEQQNVFRQIVEAYDEGHGDQANKLYDALLDEEFYRHLKLRISRKSLTRPNLLAAPINLWGLMWLQLGQFLGGQADFARCVVCAKPFRRSRSSKKTCSNKCRQAKNRRDKKERE